MGCLSLPHFRCFSSLRPFFGWSILDLGYLRWVSRSITIALPRSLFWSHLPRRSLCTPFSTRPFVHSLDTIVSFHTVIFTLLEVEFLFELSLKRRNAHCEDPVSSGYVLVHSRHCLHPRPNAAAPHPLIDGLIKNLKPKWHRTRAIMRLVFPCRQTSPLPRETLTDVPTPGTSTVLMRTRKWWSASNTPTSQR